MAGVTDWARLTWQAADPVALAADLEQRLGPGGGSVAVPAVGRVMRLVGGDLVLVSWRREAADDDPHPAGRLIFEPLEVDAPGILSPAEAAAGATVAPLAEPRFRLAGVGWATVELDRAEAELDPWLEDAPERTTGAFDVPDVPEPHLGARTRVRPSPNLPGDLLVLAEPATEGRLAASLARDGEGPCVLYLAPAEGLRAWLAAAAERGIAVSAVRRGPLGRSVLIGGARSGPHLVVVDGDVR